MTENEETILCNEPNIPDATTEAKTDDTAASDAVAEKTEPPKKGGLALWLFDIVEMAVFAILFLTLLFTFFCRTCVVSGNSMNDTLFDGQPLLISDAFYTPKRGDIVVFHQTSEENPTLNEPIIKRVIATEGETVIINFDLWTVTVYTTDGEVIVLDESSYRTLDSGRPFVGVRTYVVPEGHLFVMGDNRNHSLDSRYADIGYVDERRVLGRVVCELPSWFGALAQKAGD